MRGIAKILIAVAATGSPFSAPIAHAQDASFGCKVLLCAAASAPGWSGIPYCVPVMQTLFTEIARKKPWPTCPEGNAGDLGYEPFLPCPAGLTPMEIGKSEDQQLTRSDNGSLCADISKPQQVCTSGKAGGTCRTTFPTLPREVRENPNYVDITTAGGVQRFYFSLRGY